MAQIRFVFAVILMMALAACGIAQTENAETPEIAVVLPQLPAQSLPTLSEEDINRGYASIMGAEMVGNTLMAHVIVKSWDWWETTDFDVTVQGGVRTIAPHTHTFPDNNFFGEDMEDLPELLNQDWALNPDGQYGPVLTYQGDKIDTLVQFDRISRPQILSGNRVALFDVITGQVIIFNTVDNNILFVSQRGFHYDWTSVQIYESYMVLLGQVMGGGKSLVVINLDTYEEIDYTDAVLDGMLAEHAPEGRQPTCVVGNFVGMIRDYYIFERLEKGNEALVAVSQTWRTYVLTEEEYSQIEPIVPENPIYFLTDTHGGRRVWENDNGIYIQQPTSDICNAHPNPPVFDTDPSGA